MNPNQKVKAVMQSLMILLERPTDWTSIKKSTADPNFMSLLIELDRDNISDETAESLSNFIDENNLTDIESIKASSKAASNIASYVVNIREHWRVMDQVRPKLNQKKEVELLLAKKIVEIQKLEQTQHEMISKGVEGMGGEIRHAGLQTTFNGKKHIVHYEMEDDEGKLNIIDKELAYDPEFGEEIKAKGPNELGNYLYSQSNQNYGSNPNVEQNSLFFLSNLISKNDQSKKFVLWEQQNLRNDWDEKLQPSAKAQAVIKTNSHHWTHEPSESQKSVIDTTKTKGKVPPPQKGVETGDGLQALPKKDRQLNNIFLQSDLQARLETQLSQKKAPWSHDILNKNEKPKKYMVEGRPLFEGAGSHVQNINQGRSRIFYSSNVF